MVGTSLSGKTNGKMYFNDQQWYNIPSELGLFFIAIKRGVTLILQYLPLTLSVLNRSLERKFEFWLLMTGNRLLLLFSMMRPMLVLGSVLGVFGSGSRPNKSSKSWLLVLEMGCDGCVFGVIISRSMPPSVPPSKSNNAF